MDAVAAALLPDELQWTTALNPFFRYYPDPGLAITNSLGGALRMIVQDSDLRNEHAIPVSRDANGCSPVLRMAWYVKALCTSTDIFDIVTTSRRAVTYHYMALFVQLATDQLNVPHLPALWKNSETEDHSNLISLVAETQSVVTKWLQKSSTTDTTFTDEARKSILANVTGLSVSAYYNARACSVLVSELEETNGVTITNENYLSKAQEASDPITAVVALYSLTNPKAVLQICNRLIADLTGREFVNNPAECMYTISDPFSVLMVEALREAVLLNIAIRRLEELDRLEELPSPRLVLFVKHIVSQFQSSTLSLFIVAELYKVLYVVLRLIKDVYGSFWEDIMRFVTDDCSRIGKEKISDVPYMHAILRLYDTFHRLATVYNENEDLIDSWAQIKPVANESLVKLLQFQSSKFLCGFNN